MESIPKPFAGRSIATTNAKVFLFFLIKHYLCFGGNIVNTYRTEAILKIALLTL